MRRDANPKTPSFQKSIHLYLSDSICSDSINSLNKKNWEKYTLGTSYFR